MTADGEYSCPNKWGLSLPIQTQLTKKPNTFCCFSIAFLESRINFEHFEKKNKPHNFSLSEIIDSERRGYRNAWKVLFLKILFGGQGVKSQSPGKTNMKMPSSSFPVPCMQHYKNKLPQRHFLKNFTTNFRAALSEEALHQLLLHETRSM